MASHPSNLPLATGPELVMQVRSAPEWYFGDAPDRIVTADRSKIGAVFEAKKEIPIDTF
jgi:hypothetical protein